MLGGVCMCGVRVDWEHEEGLRADAVDIGKQVHIPAEDRFSMTCSLLFCFKKI